MLNLFSEFLNNGSRFRVLLRKYRLPFFGSSRILFFLTLVGCASAQDHVNQYAHPSPSLGDLTVCQGYGCRMQKSIRIQPFAWDEIARLFDPVPQSAADERARIAKAIALLEIKVGEVIGATTDRAAADIFSSGPDQLDCIDETVNTMTYLRLLVKEGLLRWHSLGPPQQRGWVLASFVGSTDFTTNTAVILENETGTAYAVDSYFYPNGRPPKIMPLSEWSKNWRPGTDDPLLVPLVP